MPDVCWLGRTCELERHDEYWLAISKASTTYLFCTFLGVAPQRINADELLEVLKRYTREF